MSEPGYPNPVPGGDDPARAPNDSYGESILAADSSGRTKRVLVDGSGNLLVNVAAGGSTPNVNIHDSSGGNLTSTTGSLNVNVTNASGLDTVNQGNPANPSNAWPIKVTDSAGVNEASVSAAGAVKVDNSAVTQPISATSLPLPTNASQETGGHLASLDSKTTTVDTGHVTISTALPAGNNQIGHIITDTGSTISVSNFPATQPVSGTVTTVPPSHASTNVDQIGGSSITEGQKTMSASVPVVIASDQSAVTVTGTVTTSPNVNIHDSTGTNLTSTSNALDINIKSGSIANTGFNVNNAPNITNITGTVSLPTGAATSVNQTNASQKTQIVDGSGNVIASTTNSLNVDVTNTVPVTLTSTTITGNVTVVQPTGTNLHAVIDSGTITANSTSDSSPATQNITVQDTGSTTTSGFNGQSIITGTPTANSTASFSLSSINSIEVQITGTWTGTLQTEVSLDGGTAWYKSGGHQKGVSSNSSSFTSNFQVETGVAGFTNFRVRATAAMTGTATVKVVETVNSASIYVTNPIALVDGNGTTNQAAITASNALKVDGSSVVQPITRVGTTLNVGQVSITTSATQILASNTNRKRILITNTGTTNVYIGGSGVTATTGHLLQGTAGYPISLLFTGAVYGIVSSGTQTITYAEEAV